MLSRHKKWNTRLNWNSQYFIQSYQPYGAQLFNEETDDEDSNQPMQKYRCSYKAFKWSKHSQKRKLWVCLQYGDREISYSYRNVLLSFVPVVLISHLEALFSFSVFIRNAHCTSINECMRTSNLSA